MYLTVKCNYYFKNIYCQGTVCNRGAQRPGTLPVLCRLQECVQAHNGCTRPRIDAHWCTHAHWNKDACRPVHVHWHTVTHAPSLVWCQTVFIRKTVSLCSCWLIFGSPVCLFLCFLASVDSSYRLGLPRTCLLPASWTDPTLSNGSSLCSPVYDPS